MSNFDDWVNKNYPELLKNQGITLAMCMSFAKEGYEAGQQSKQQEIDRLNCLLADLHKTCMNIKEGHIREHCQEYDKGWRDCAVAIRTQGLILNGN